MAYRENIKIQTKSMQNPIKKPCSLDLDVAYYVNFDIPNILNPTTNNIDNNVK